MTKRMTPVDDRLYAYMRQNSLREAEVLAALREETERLGELSRMQIAPEQGQFMYFLTRLLSARKLLEVGTFTGYSTLWCALALPGDGCLIACDISEPWTTIGKRYWERAGVSHKIDLRLGPAVETLEALVREGQSESFDLMLIDADKTGYDDYYEYGLRLVRPGGVMMIDNVFWMGAVTDPGVDDPETRAIRALNAKIHSDDRVSMVMLPIGDGFTLVSRNGERFLKNT